MKDPLAWAMVVFIALVFLVSMGAAVWSFTHQP